MPGLDDSTQSSNRKQMELQAEFLIKSVEEIEATNRQLCASGKRKADPSSETLLDSPTAEERLQGQLESSLTPSNVRSTTSKTHNPLLLRSHRALADDLSSCVGIPSTTDQMVADGTTDASDRLREIQSNAELKIRRLLHRVSHLEEQLALTQADNERLKQATIFKPSRQIDAVNEDDPTQQYLNKLMVQQRALIQENAKLKRELLSTCTECRLNGRTIKDQPSPVKRPTFQSSARHVLENLPRQQDKNSSRQQHRKAWSTAPQSWNPRHANT